MSLAFSDFCHLSHHYFCYFRSAFLCTCNSCRNGKLNSRWAADPVSVYWLDCMLEEVYNIMQCMQFDFLLTGQVYPMLMSSAPHAWAYSIEKVPFLNWLYNFFLKGVVFLSWHDIVHIELLYSVTKSKFDWTCIKVAAVKNAKMRLPYPTFPYTKCTFLVEMTFRMTASVMCTI